MKADIKTVMYMFVQYSFIISVLESYKLFKLCSNIRIFAIVIHLRVRKNHGYFSIRTKSHRFTMKFVHPFLAR